MGKKKYIKTTAILLVVILLAVFIPQHQAKAVCPVSISDCFVSLNGLILAFLGTAIGWAAGLLNSFIQYQTNNGVYGVSIIDQSWTIIRNFVNLFFILILIVIAFGTIFDVQKYRWQDLLPSFIIAALLINFSLTIGQYFITISNGLAGVFLKQIGDPSTTFAQGSSIAKLITSGQQASLLSGVTRVVITGIFSIVFLAITFLALLSAAIFSIARLFVLWFLLIISPIAWLGYALPYIKKQTWTDWWHNFYCWCFFLPFYLFFLMFAVIFINAKGSLPAPSGGNFPGISLVANDFIFYGLSLIFLVGGLGVALKMACAAGTGVKAVFGKIEGSVRKYAPGAAYVRGGIAGLKERGAEIAERGVLGIGGAQRARLQEATAKGFVAGGRPGMAEEKNRALAAEVDKEVKRLQLLNLTLDELNAKIKTAKGPEGLAAFKMKAENGWLEANDLSNINKMLDDVGGGKTAMGASIIASLKKGKFNEMAQTTAQKEFIFDHLTDVDVKKAFGLDMAESREITNEDIAKSLLDLYSGDTKEVQNKVAEAIKNNIENIARDAGARKDLVNGTGAFVGADPRLRKLAGQVTVEKKEVDSWKLRRQILELNGGIDPATGDAQTVEGRKLASDIKDSSTIIREEAEYRKNNPGTTNHATNLITSQRDAVSNQILDNIDKKLITSFTTEDLKTPEIFNALFNGVQSGRISSIQFNKLAGLSTGKGKPDRKKREAGAIIEEAIRTGTPMPY